MKSIATGERSEHIASTLRELESFARTATLRLPSLDAAGRSLDRWLGEAPVVGREKLRAILKDGVIRLDTTAARSRSNNAISLTLLHILPLRRR